MTFRPSHSGISKLISSKAAIRIHVYVDIRRTKERGLRGYSTQSGGASRRARQTKGVAGISTSDEIFEIKSTVRTKYRFTAEPAKDTISLTISNYDNIWSQTNYFKKIGITAQLMDELTHHVMREPNKYNELVGNIISDEARTKLRAKLKADITAKKAHVAKQEAKEKESKKK